MAATAFKSHVIDCPRNLEGVREAARALRHYLSIQGVDEEHQQHWELLAVEAGNNAVQYINPGNPNIAKPVRFLVNLSADCVEIAISDHSEGFDWPERVALPDDDSERGRGLFLINELTDSVRYLRGHQENFLVMRKNRSIPSPATDVQRDSTLELTLQMMTEELVSTYESLAAIFRFSSELGRVDDVHTYAEKWLGELLKVTESSWYVLRQFDPVSSTLNLVAASGGQGPCPEALAMHPDGQDGTCIEVSTALRGADTWFDGNTPEENLTALQIPFGQPLSGVCHPIFIGRQLFGVLSIGTRLFAPSFSVSQINVIHTFADLLGVQINNVQNQHEALHARVVTRELQVAAGIQRSLLPRVLPQPDGFQIAAHSSSANQVGGDFYDVISTSSGGVLLAIADVMGKGVPAAMFAAIFRSHLRARPDLLCTPGKLMKWLNRVLFADLDNVDMFVTAQLAYLDLSSRILCLASAGHCPALLVDGRCHEVRTISGDGPPLGIAPDAIYTEEKCELPERSRLLIYTDGLVETRDATGTALGDEAVSSWFSQTSRESVPASTACASLCALASAHSRGQAITDDITFLLLTADARRESLTPEAQDR